MNPDRIKVLRGGATPIPIQDVCGEDIRPFVDHPLRFIPSNSHELARLADDVDMPVPYNDPALRSNKFKSKFVRKLFDVGLATFRPKIVLLRLASAGPE